MVTQRNSENLLGTVWNHNGEKDGLGSSFKNGKNQVVEIFRVSSALKKTHQEC